MNDVNGKPVLPIPVDDFHGKGGSYTLDAQGKRAVADPPTISPGEEGYTPPPAPQQGS